MTGILKVDTIQNNGGTTGLTIDSSGLIATPARPAFLYRTGTQQNITANTWLTVNFNDKLFEVGSNFNTTNKSFVAPVDGLYQFNASVRTDNVDSASNYLQVKFTGGPQDHHFGLQTLTRYSGDLAYMQWSGSTAMLLSANDAISIQIYQSGGSAQTDIQNDSRFSGFLVG